MADTDTLARPYARAIFSVASANDQLGPVSAALTAAGQVVSDPSVANLLDHPNVSDADLLGFLRGIFAEIAEAAPLAAAGGNGENLLRLLIENDRLGLLPAIATQVEALKLDAERVVDVTVTTATALDDSQLAAIGSALKTRLGRDVNMTTSLDESLLGGAVIRAGDFVIDGSVRAKLTRLSASLQR